MARPPAPKTPSTVNDFVVLPLRLPVQPSFPTEATHYLYLRPHAPKVPTLTSSREIFIVNVPVDATDLHIRSLFADQLGGSRVESVAFEGARVGRGIRAPVAPPQSSKKRKRDADAISDADAPEIGTLPAIHERELHRSGSTAIVTFVDKPSVELALREARRAVKNGQRISWSGPNIDREIPSLGLARYRAHHHLRFPDRAILQNSVDEYMSAFSAKEEARAQALAKLRSEPDEDGFITVTRGGRKGPAREEATKAKEEELKQREKNRVKEDFYRFQVREKKKEQARDLVKSFEEDQRRVAEMKKLRGKIRPEK